MGTYLSMDQLHPPNSRGEIQTIVHEQNSRSFAPFSRNLANRARLSWQEQAKIQMEALARSLEASAGQKMPALVGWGSCRKAKEKRRVGIG